MRLCHCLSLVLGLILSFGVASASPITAARPDTETVAPCAANEFSCSSVTEIPQSECEALVALHAATGGATWKNNAGWLGTDTPCSWYGVTCASGHVSGLLLYYNQLSGTIPPEIGDLAALQNLNLSGNQLSAIPPEIGDLTALLELYIFYSHLGGTIPQEIGNLTALQQLDLSDNQLSGAIPLEIGSLTAMRSLGLAYNQLSGVIPPEIGNLAALQDLYLQDNQLTGAIPPAIGSLVTLRSLWLSGNQLSGAIPLGIGSLTALQNLVLHSNQLSGVIPAQIGNLTALQSLSLNNNQLSGPIPSEIRNLTALQQLSLGYNQLSGAIPPEIGNLTALTYLAMYNNQLSGPVPPEIGYLTRLTSLSLDNNELTGVIPPEIGSLTALQWLGLSGNQLIGAIPPEIGSLTALQGLGLSGNQLNSVVPPEIGTLAALQQLYLSNNQLSGEIPPSITDLTNLIDNQGANLGYNTLVSSDPAVQAFLAVKGPDWSNTQTVPPINLAASPSGSGVVLTWTPIAYTWNDGYYEISYSDAPTGPFIVHGTTSDKNASSYVASTGLSVGVPYYFRLRTYTPPHDAQQNALWSEYTVTVSATLSTLDVGSISGVVIEQATGDPLEGVGVCHWDYDTGDDFACASTDAYGVFTIQGLPAGDYRVRATKSDFSWQFFSGTTQWDDAARVSVVNGHVTSGIDFSMEPGGNISGFVHNSDGTIPLANTKVEIVRDGTGWPGCTDANGHYEFDNVPYAAAWRVRAAPGPDSWCGESQAYIWEYWQEAASWDNATTLTLNAGMPAFSDINFTLERGASISGHVYQSDGVTVISDALISVHASGISSGSSSLGTNVSQVDGSYTISGLAPGIYKVQANNNRAPGYVTKYYDDKFTWDSADTIEVVAGQITPGIDFALETGGTIRGTVLKEGGGVITDVQLSVGAGTETGLWASAPVSQVDGSYELTGLADGVYRVEANFFTLGYDRKYYDDVYRWDQATLVPIAGGSTASSINFALGPGGGIIGHVYAQDGITPVEGACVNVSSTAPEFNQVAGWGRTGPDGSFSFGGVPVGNVYVRTHASCSGGISGYIDEWYAEGGSVVEGIDASAVQIVAGQFSNDIDFTLDPGGSISGAIYNADGSMLLNNVMYGFESATQQGSYTTWCTGDGVFAADLALGSYKVFAQGNSEHCGGDPNYRREYWQEEATWTAAEIITLTSESPHVTGLIFTLEPGGMISGTVRQADGITAIANAWVYAMDSQFQFVAGGRSQPDGSYLIGGLSQGSFYVAVQAEGFGGVYYPNGHDDSGAVLVQVIPPETTPNIDFTLSPEATVSGIVWEDDASTPIPNALVCVWPNGGGQVRSARADGDGSYTVHGLSTGTYVAKAEADGFETEFHLNAFDWSSAALIAVTQPDDTPGIVFTLSRPSPAPLAEKQALEALYNSTNGSQWTHQDGWLVDPDACTWYGVTCLDGHVVAIHLESNQLSGTIPPGLSTLVNLQSLYLSSNQLSGTIPPELGNLVNLRWLWLSGNQLSGSIPPELGSLVSLRGLGMSTNQLSGSIPSEFGGLAEIQQLYLTRNQLSGSIPSELGNLANLQYLYLATNQLGGPVPRELGLLSNLKALRLYATQLSGPLPTELTDLAALSDLQFNDTDLCEPQDIVFQAWLDDISTVVSTDVACALTLTKEADPDPAVAGEPLTYYLTLRNMSAGVLFNDVVLIDTLPEDVTLLGAYPSPTTQLDRVLTWDVGTLAFEGVFLATIQVQMPAESAEIYNQADTSATPSAAARAPAALTETATARARYTVRVFPRAGRPSVVASRSGDDVTLSWDPPAVPVFHHEVWWDEGNPYFVPGDDCAAAANCVRAYGPGFGDLGAAAEPATNRSYLVLAVNEAGRSEPSNRVAEFGFSLVPGGVGVE